MSGVIQSPFLPVKNWWTCQQNGREIRTLNLELNRTQRIKTGGKIWEKHWEKPFWQVFW